MQHLAGDVALMAVPAEEFVELEYHWKLKEAGKIELFGGKQEFIYYKRGRPGEYHPSLA